MEVWFWNENANETDSDFEEEGPNNVDNLDLKPGIEEKMETEQLACTPEVKLKWNREGKKNLCGGYRKESRSSLKRQQKKTQELEIEASKSYNIKDMFQQSNSCNSLNSFSNSLPSEVSLFEIPLGGPPPLSKQQIHKNQRVEALKDLTWLLELVTEQEKKYGNKFLPLSSFY